MITQAEKQVCRRFRKETNSESSDDDDSDSGKGDFIHKEFEKARKKGQRRPAVRVTVSTAISLKGV